MNSPESMEGRDPLLSRILPTDAPSRPKMARNPTDAEERESASICTEVMKKAN